MGLAAISYDSPDVLKHFAARKGIGFPLLSDSDSSVIRAFGILNEEVPEDSPFFGVPHPAVYIVDPSGKVQSVHFEDDFRKRPTISNILSGRLPPTGRAARTTVQSPRLTVIASSSDATVRGGERIRLFVDVKLPPGMHVYAPGVEGYIPVSWTMSQSPAYESFVADYPKGRMMRLEAIKETVPVYENQVTFARDIIVAQPEKAGDLLKSGVLKLEGEFRYQACDATKCYVPETLPLEWELRFEPHDRTRVPPELRRKVQ